MKKLGLFLCLVLFLTAIVAFWLTSRSDKNYLNAIPTDSRALFEVNLRLLTEEFDANIVSSLTDFISEDHTELGLNLANPIVGFYTQKGYVGVLAQVSNSSALQQNLHQKGYETETQRGLQWSVVEDWLICYDDEKMLVLGPGARADHDALRKEMNTLMHQGENENALFASLQERNGFFKSVADMHLLSTYFSDFGKMFKNKGFSPNELFLHASLGSEGKELFMNVEFLTENDSLLSLFNELDASFHQIQGTNTSGFVTNSLCWFGINVTGDKLLEQMRSFPQIRTMLLALNMCVDADLMLKSIDGDVTISIPEISLLTTPSVLLRAQLNNTDFLEKSEDWKTGFSADAGVDFQEYTPTDFSLRYKGERYFFGVYEGHLYLTNKRDVVEGLKREPLLSTVYDEAANVRFYSSIDASRMLKLAATYLLWLGAPAPLYELLDDVERVNLKIYDSRHYEFELKFVHELKEVVSRSIEQSAD